jgi:hypothetical protein
VAHFAEVQEQVAGLQYQSHELAGLVEQQASLQVHLLEQVAVVQERQVLLQVQLHYSTRVEQEEQLHYLLRAVQA